jgi:D-aspartate ligase
MDLVRPLGLGGIHCAVVAGPGDVSRHSRFTEAVLDWVDPWNHPEALVERLLSFARTQSAKPVLYYEGDWDLLLVSRFREQLESGFRFVVADAALVEALVDKSEFQELASRADLPVPPSRRISASRMSRHDLDLRFPIVLKPLTRQMAIWRPVAGSAKALYVEDEAELEKVWPRLAESAIELLAQELVPGPESAIESYHAYIDADGEVVGEFTGKKIRTYPQSFGFSTALEITAHRDVAELGRDLAARLRLSGVAKFDFKRGRNGELYLLEVNPRFNLWHHPGAKAGVNLPALVYHDLVGLPRPAARTARPGVRWCHQLHDARAARAEGMSLLQWLPWASRCEAKSAVAWDDPMPMVYGLLARVRGAAKRRMRRDNGDVPASLTRTSP